MAAAVAGLKQPALDFSLPRAFLVGRSISFALICLMLALMLFRGDRQAGMWTKRGAVAIVTWSLLEHVIFSPNAFSIPLVVIFNALFWSAVMFLLRHPGVRSYYQEHPA